MVAQYYYFNWELTMSIEEDKLYTKDEVTSQVHMEVAKHRMEQLERHIKAIESNANKSFSSLQAGITGLRELMQEYNKRTAEDQIAFKKELEEDFVTVEVFNLRMTQMDKDIKSLWIRITTALTAVIVTAQVVSKMVG